MRVRGSHVQLCSLPAGFSITGLVATYDVAPNEAAVSWTHAGPDPLGWDLIIVCESGTYEFLALAGGVSLVSQDVGGGQTGTGTVTLYALDSCGARAVSAVTTF